MNKYLTTIDIDDLSSGEKSLIQLFYPLIEHRVRNILVQLKGEEVAQPAEPICALIDEPELHLHPNLQGKILDYFRALGAREEIQFVIATHSPTIVEYANSEELYLLRPREMVSDHQNQLLRIATDEEKLGLLREVFGSTSNLTAMRPIIVVEGKQENRQSRRALDARLYAFLSDEFSRVTLLPSGGKSECRSLARSLGEILRGFSQELRAYALLDRDLEEDDVEEDHVHLLPVSMVENLLVDPQVIWQATVVVHHKMTLVDEKAIEKAIDAILEDSANDEIARRIKAEIGTRVFRLSDPVDDALQQVAAFTNMLKTELTAENLAGIRAKCQTKVDEIKAKKKRREFFHGKYILDEFYKRHMHETGMSREIFLYECARCASERDSVKTFVTNLMSSIGLHEVEEMQEDAPRGA